MFSKASKQDAAAKRPATPSIIAADLHIVGNLKCEGEIQIDGSIDGDINGKIILVGETAVIKGELIADVIRVHGTVNGQIRAREVTLARTARMTGDILHEKLAIEQGAFLEGHCRHVEHPKVETEKRPALEAPKEGAAPKPAADTSKPAPEAAPAPGPGPAAAKPAPAA